MLQLDLEQLRGAVLAVAGTQPPQQPPRAVVVGAAAWFAWERSAGPDLGEYQRKMNQTLANLALLSREVGETVPQLQLFRHGGSQNSDKFEAPKIPIFLEGDNNSDSQKRTAMVFKRVYQTAKEAKNHTNS